MSKFLHIQASPRIGRSASIAVAEYFIGFSDVKKIFAESTSGPEARDEAVGIENLKAAELAAEL